MKKISLIVVALVLSVAANAQFEKGKGYIGASLSGIDISNQTKEFHLGLNAKLGYMFEDNLMALGEVGYDHWDKGDDKVEIGAGARYYIVQNGLYIGAGLKYKHAKDYNDLLPCFQLGYAFFLGRTVTLEPELYFDISTKKFDYTCYGLRLGIGVYLFKDQYKIRK
jgi:hypothetical protein